MLTHHSLSHVISLLSLLALVLQLVPLRESEGTLATHTRLETKPGTRLQTRMWTTKTSRTRSSLKVSTLPPLAVRLVFSANPV